MNSLRVQLGGFDVVNPADKEWTEEAGKRTASMIRVTRQAATRFNQIILTKVGKDGLGKVAELAKVVEATMGRFIVSDAMTIARTETGFLQESLKQRAAVAEGFTHHEWSNAFDARPSHQDQGSVRIGEKFPTGCVTRAKSARRPRKLLIAVAPRFRSWPPKNGQRIRFGRIESAYSRGEDLMPITDFPKPGDDNGRHGISGTTGLPAWWHKSNGVLSAPSGNRV
jgi:hypothetical protein